MYHEVREGNVLTVNHVKDVLRSEYPHADIQSILGVHSEYDEGRKVCWEQSGKKYCSTQFIAKLKDCKMLNQVNIVSLSEIFLQPPFRHQFECWKGFCITTLKFFYIKKIIYIRYQTVYLISMSRGLSHTTEIVYLCLLAGELKSLFWAKRCCL